MEITKEQFLLMQEQLRKATEDKAFSKMLDNRMIIEVYLNQPQAKVLEEYYFARLQDMLQELVNSPLNHKGRDVSDIIRGKIMMLQEIINMKHVFKTYDGMKEQVEKVKKGN